MSTVIAMPEVKPEVIQQTNDTLSTVKSFQIATAIDYAVATDLARDIVGVRKKIVDTFADPKQNAFNTHKSIVALEKKFLAPVEEAERIIKGKIGAYSQEQQRLERERKREAQEEANRIEQEQQLELAIAAEQNKASVEEVEAILTAPVYAVAAPVEKFEQAKGVAVPMLYSAEVEDLNKLFEAAYTDKALRAYFLINQPAINAAAKAQKEMMSIPGVKLIKTPSVRIK
jgi:hypothetical protein